MNVDVWELGDGSFTESPWDGVCVSGGAGWLSVATRRDVVRRGLGYAVVVGAILIGINHGDAILRGDLSIRRLLKMALTVVVPYLVSTFSSVGAMRHRD